MCRGELIVVGDSGIKWNLARGGYAGLRNRLELDGRLKLHQFLFFFRQRRLDLLYVLIGLFLYAVLAATLFILGKFLFF